MVRNIASFVFCYKCYLIIQKIKAKFLVGENKYVRVLVLQIYVNISLKCNTHIVRFDITHR